MVKMRPIRKRCFLMLELMIALFLIITCMLPLLKSNCALYKLEAKRKKSWEAFTQDRACLVNFKQKLFEQKYSWEELKAGFTDPNGVVTVIKKQEDDALVLQLETAVRKHYIYIERAR